MSIRKRRTKEQKAKIALEALKENRPLAEIALQYGVHPNQITRWKKQLIQNAGDVFSKNNDSNREKELEQYQDELYMEIGKLRVENEFLKKKFHQLEL